MQELLFTVFTPTFNRAHTLPRVFASLQQQTFQQFEWLIVDDGSTDETAQLVEKWRTEAHFPIQYIYQTNQGKHVAHNTFLQHARGELCVILDSDDACVPDALMIFYTNWQAIPTEQRSRFGGVVTLCIDQHGKLIGDQFPAGMPDGSCLALTFQQKIRGEKWSCITTAALRRYPFPPVVATPYGIPYVPETTIWYPLTRDYRFRFVNQPTRIYWVNEAADQMSTTSDLRRNAPGSLANYESALNYTLAWFRYAPRTFFRIAIQYARLAFFVHRNLKAQRQALQPLLARCLWFIGLPIGWLLYQRDRLRYIRQSLSASANPLRRFTGLVLKRTGLCRLFTIDCGAFHLRFYPTALSATLWDNPEDRHGDEDFFHKYLRPGDVVIDAGANIGYLTLAALISVGESGYVYAIEPHPRIHHYLQGNLALNRMGSDRVTTFNVALGNRSGTVTFSDIASDDTNRVNNQGAGLTVDLKRLDQLPIRPGPLALLKVDVEGFEKFVLEGAAALLDRVDCIYFEYYEAHYTAYGYSGTEILTGLEARGFQILRMIDEGVLTPVAATYISKQYINLFAVRNLAEFRQRTGFTLVEHH